MVFISRALMRQVMVVLAALALLVVVPPRVFAQGCEPIRFSTPNFGGQGQSYQRGHEWWFTIGYRRLSSDQWFIGTVDRPDLGPGGRSPIINVNSFVADLAYAATDRLTVHLAVPFSTGTAGKVFPDKAWHDQNATGIGDMSLSADAWLLDPSSHGAGNVALGLGVSAPTGSDQASSQFYLLSGPIAFPADMAIEPGSGGWGFTVQTKGFAKLFPRAFGYFSGSYTFTPQTRTDVRFKPAAQFWSVADGYSGRVGFAYTLLPEAGLTVSLGGRIDGTPVHDVFGNDDSTYRRPGYVIYADPGVGFSRGPNSLSLSVPLRLRADRLKNVLEQQNSVLVPGGGFASSLIFLSYSRRL